MRHRLTLLIPILLAVFVLSAPPAHATDHFIVQCAYSHSLADDPILYPDMPGAGHLHDFVGNTTTDAYSTYDSLLAGTSTCGTPNGVDNAAYWMPAMWIGGVRYLPKYSRVYYMRDAPSGVHVVAFPPGAELIAGNMHSTTPSPGVVSFSCGAHTTGDTPGAGNGPYDCAPYLGGDDSRDGMIGRIIFPHCWDGTGSQPSDFTGYSATCPTGWLYVPRIRISFHYFACGANDTIYDGMGTPGPGVVTVGPDEQGMLMPWTGLHADFINAWDQSALQGEIDKVINTQPNTLGTFFGKKVGDPGTPTC